MTDSTASSHPAEAAQPEHPRCTNAALRRATRHLGALYDEALAPAGLKATQFALLGQIARPAGDEPGPTLQALAERVAVGLSALTHALRPLVRDGLVRLVPDARDRRAKRAALTPEGQVRLQQAVRLWAAANRQAEALLGADAALLRATADRVASPEFSAAFRVGLAG